MVFVYCWSLHQFTTTDLWHIKRHRLRPSPYLSSSYSVDSSVHLRRTSSNGNVYSLQGLNSFFYVTAFLQRAGGALIRQLWFFKVYFRFKVLWQDHVAETIPNYCRTSIINDVPVRSTFDASARKSSPNMFIMRDDKTKSQHCLLCNVQYCLFCPLCGHVGRNVLGFQVPLFLQGSL